MIITVISGSTRKDSQSRRVCDYLAGRLAHLGVETAVVDLHEKKLPLYDDAGEGAWKPVWEEVSGTLEKSDGFVFVSPEWDGMMSVGIHNLFHYADKEMADKPVLPVGVSSGRGGRYPLQQMRIMGYKNKRFVVIPESLFFDYVEKGLVDGALTDARATERADYALRVLMEYARALASVRASGTIDYAKFPSGW